MSSFSELGPLLLEHATLITPIPSLSQLRFVILNCRRGGRKLCQSHSWMRYLDGNQRGSSRGPARALSPIGRVRRLDEARALLTARRSKAPSCGAVAMRDGARGRA